MTLRFTGVTVLCMLAAGRGLGEGDGSPSPAVFERYGVILDRKPFGEEVIPVAAAANLVSPEQSFTAKFKMVAVTRDRTTGVIAVGLVDLKSNRSYMLGVGDSIEGVEVVEADYTTERARLRRTPEDYWVSMGSGSNHFEVAGHDAPPANPPPAFGAGPRPGPGGPPPGMMGPGRMRPGPQPQSYSARKQSREEIRIRRELEKMKMAEAQRLKASKTNEPSVSVASVRSGKGKGNAAPLSETAQALLEKLGRSEDADLSQEEVNALLQQYQKELIRSGQTPLPIPLTPETDRALVEEGVLPPQEE